MIKSRQSIGDDQVRKVLVNLLGLSSQDSESSCDSSMFFTMYSQRGHKLIVLDGYKFRKDRETQLGKRWRCTVSTCNAQILTSLENEEEVIDRLGEHNHDTSKKLPREFISNNLKQKHGNKEDIPLEILSAPPDLRCQITSADINRAKRNIRPRNRSKKKSSGHLALHDSFCETILTVSWTHRDVNWLLYPIST